MRNSQDNVLEVWLDCDLVRVPFLGSNATVRNHRTPLRNRLSLRATDFATENKKAAFFWGRFFVHPLLTC